MLRSSHKLKARQTKAEAARELRCPAQVPAKSHQKRKTKKNIECNFICRTHMQQHVEHSSAASCNRIALLFELLPHGNWDWKKYIILLRVCVCAELCYLASVCIGERLLISWLSYIRTRSPKKKSYFLLHTMQLSVRCNRSPHIVIAMRLPLPRPPLLWLLLLSIQSVLMFAVLCKKTHAAMGLPANNMSLANPATRSPDHLATRATWWLHLSTRVCL